MKTAIIRSASVLASLAALGSAFLATPALAAYYPYGYQQPVQSVCTNRFDPSCILKETQALVASSFSGYNQNHYQQYQAPTYSYGYTYPTYQNQTQYSYPSYNSYNNYDSNYSYNSNPYSAGYTVDEYPAYTNDDYYDSYPSNSYDESSSYESGYQYQYGYSYNYSY